MATARLGRLMKFRNTRKSGSRKLGSKAIWLLSGASAALIGLGATARANDFPADQASARARAACAALGPGFAAVEGAGACVLVSGRVRVGYGPRGGDSPDTGWATGTAVRVNAAGAGALAPGHLRLPDGGSGGTIAR